MASEQPAVQESQSDMEARLGSQLLGDEEPQEEEAQPAESEAAESPEQEAQPHAEELEDVEFQGKQYKLPKELKSALMAQSDYTRKTQDLSSLRGVVDAKVVMSQQEQQFHSQIAPELQQLTQLEAEIARYGKVDWQTLDTDTLVRTRHALDQLKEQRNDLRGQLQAKREAFNSQLQQSAAAARAKGLEYLSRNIPDWNEAAQKSVVEYGLKRGYSEVKLRSMDDPLDVETLWKAMQWDHLQAEKPGATNKARNAPPVKPGASISSQQAAQLDDARFAKQMKNATSQGRRAQIAGERIGARLERILTGG